VGDELGTAARTLDRVSCRLWISGESGRISAKDVIGGDDPRNTAFMMCGSAPFATALMRQLRAAGVPRANIFSEGFAFR
jgi:ferredoxin-NADP reductase